MYSPRAYSRIFAHIRAHPYMMYEEVDDTYVVASVCIFHIERINHQQIFNE